MIEKDKMSREEIIAYYRPQIEKLIPYIHWTFFFSAWKLAGRYAEITQIHGCDSCRAMWLAGFPENERAKAAEAMQLYKDATRLLDRLVAEKMACCKAIYGFFPGSDFDYASLEKKEPGWLMLVPMLLLAAGVVLTGVLAQPLISAFASVASAVL